LASTTDRAIMSGDSGRDRQRRETGRALQAAAIRLVNERGFTDVTVDDIATAAGVARRTFFNHFPTKAAALFDPDPDDAERLATLLRDADGGCELWAALRTVCVSFVAGHEQVIAVRRRLVAEMPELDQYHATAHRHVAVAIGEWANQHCRDDPFTATLLAQTAAVILTSAFSAWQPDDDAALLPELVDRGFALISLKLS
jgi:AcrR family transcriptional regulator